MEDKLLGMKEVKSLNLSNLIAPSTKPMYDRRALT